MLNRGTLSAVVCQAAGAIAALILAITTMSDTPAYAAGIYVPCQPSQQHPASISLPKDDAPHRDPVEWYYNTGHLTTLEGKRYGFETVVFQFWLGSFTTVGQFALTDLNNGTFHHQTYQIPGPFPASSNSFNVTLPQGLTMSGGNGSERITASLPDGYRINLGLYSIKNPVYQDGDGLIPYIDPSTGQQISTQFYYSRPRMATTFAVVSSPTGSSEVASGESWFDHEYGLLPSPVNWEWFSIQLDDGREIMAYTIRQFHTPNAYAKFGSIQNATPGCGVQSLGASNFSMSLQGSWRSPHTGITYPNQFGLSVPSRDLQLTLTPQLADQEVFPPSGSIVPPYWEGAVAVKGTENKLPVSGTGYVELVEN
jgi:predicted secreted hydrolase